MLFEVLYPFVLDGEVKHPHMFVDIDDYETGMRLLAAGAVVEVQEQPARPNISGRKPDHGHFPDVVATAEMNAAGTTQPAVTYHAVMYHLATDLGQHARKRDVGLIRGAWARWRHGRVVPGFLCGR